MSASGGVSLSRPPILWPATFSSSPTANSLMSLLALLIYSLCGAVAQEAYTDVLGWTQACTMPTPATRLGLTAVRKHREKKKSRTASLEDEVVRLWAMNQQLMKRLQEQALLEAEIAKLKCLLVDIRVGSKGKLGLFLTRSRIKLGMFTEVGDRAAPFT
ncbi:Basic-leucine zipper (bZIP) transcription factor family protein [Striga hermonthica]|uniref:Basic-leucine zipper (BZIP) transcription factor family protein n=1 Tax=Striga hermonthica TaxID=68872 RepID=A0A9N7RAK5_STRHE|nr:Basic-leucine zipper (bZIP) transcription factor family protein [Striga hermonthica]